MAGLARGPWPCGVDLEVDVVCARRRGEGRRTAGGAGLAERFGAYAGGGVRGLAARGCRATYSADGVGFVVFVAVRVGEEVVVGSRGKVLNAILRAFDAEGVGVDKVSTVAFRDGDDEPLNMGRTRHAAYRQDGKTQGLVYVGQQQTPGVRNT